MSPCNCGSNRSSLVIVPQGSFPLPLAGFDDCTEMYTGPAKVVVVVDRLGPNQRIYPGYEAGEAAQYANSHGLDAYEVLAAFRLCAAAVNDIPSA